MNPYGPVKGDECGCGGFSCNGRPKRLVTCEGMAHDDIYKTMPSTWKLIRMAAICEYDFGCKAPGINDTANGWRCNQHHVPDPPLVTGLQGKTASIGPLHVDAQWLIKTFDAMQYGQQAAKPSPCSCGFTCAKAEGRPMAAGCYCRAHR